jgi:hypothetical protein
LLVNSQLLWYNVWICRSCICTTQCINSDNVLLIKMQDVEIMNRTWFNGGGVFVGANINNMQKNIKSNQVGLTQSSE